MAEGNRLIQEVKNLEAIDNGSSQQVFSGVGIGTWTPMTGTGGYAGFMNGVGSYINMGAWPGGKLYGPVRPADNPDFDITAVVVADGKFIDSGPNEDGVASLAPQDDPVDVPAGGTLYLVGFGPTYTADDAPTGTYAYFAWRTLPPIAPGDAGKVVTVNGGENGYELDAPSGGGGGVPCWFMAFDVAASGSPTLEVQTDVPEVGTDAVLDTDPTRVKVAVAGVYDVLLDWKASFSDSAGGGVQIYPIVNDDSVGPAYYLNPQLGLPTPGNVAHSVTLPLTLAANDTLAVSISLSGDGTSVGQVALALARRN